MDLRDKNVANIEFIETISKMFKLITIRFQNIWLHNDFLFNLSSLTRKQDEYVKILHHMSNKILQQRKEKLLEEEQKGSKFKTFMDLLLEVSRDTNTFTDEEIREHVDTIVVAGLDTSARGLVYCMLLVGSYPHVQEKIHGELKNVFGDEDRDITKQDLSQLVYLEAAIKESLGIYPIVPVIGRYIDEDVKLRKTYAMMSLKIIMAHFCRNYMVYGDHTKLTLKLDVMLKPVSGHHIAIEKRKCSK